MNRIAHLHERLARSLAKGGKKMSGKWNAKQRSSSGDQPSENGGGRALPLLNFVWPLTRKKVIGAVMTWSRRVLWPLVRSATRSIWRYLRSAIAFFIAFLIQHGWKERKEHPRIAATAWIISLIVLAAYGWYLATSVAGFVQPVYGSEAYPVTELAPPNSFSAMPAVTESPLQAQSGGECQYTVEPGDNLFRISLRYNTTVGTLARENSIADPNLISIGQVLTVCSGEAIPEQPAPVVSASESSCITHTVEPGENLFRISLRYNVPIRRIAERNAIADINLISAGQEIQICK